MSVFILHIHIPRYQSLDSSPRIFIPTIPLQLISHPLPTQIRHCHNLRHQGRPAREMLCPLPFTRFRIILFPRETCFLPAVIDCVDQIFSEPRVERYGLRLVGAGLLGGVLGSVSVGACFEGWWYGEMRKE